MTHLFVSHATTDDAVVTRIHDQLEAAGLNAWVDHKDIQPADDWEQAIQDALTGCAAGLYVLSPRSANRDEIRPEIRTLIALGKPLYVALIEHMPPPQFPYRLRTIQYVDLTKDFAAGMATLIAAVQGGRPLTPDAPHTVREFHVTGDISVELTNIPMSGRDADLQQVIAHLAGGYVTSILGVGGLGKSRLAAEVVLRDEWADGAVWHVASDYSTADDALALLREHLALPVTASRADVLHAVRAHKTLVVIDNAESVTDARLPAYVALVNDLKAHTARVLITGRVEWDGLKLGREHHPALLTLDAARQVVLDMRAAWGVTADLSAYAERIAAAAKQHPRLIEWSVRKLKKFPPTTVIRELEAFKSKDVQTALDGMIRQTVEQMTAQHGAEHAAALRKLNVFRGGFTYQAAGVMLGLVAGEQPSDQPTLYDRLMAMLNFLQNAGELDDETLADRLAVLQTWQFVTYADDRFTVNPLVLATVGADKAAHQPHYDYYMALANAHKKKQDYASLDVESDNLTAAFEWALTAEPEGALWLANRCSEFLLNRGRIRQYLDWRLRVRAALTEHNDELRTNALNSLGDAYRNLAQVEDREANLHRAIAAFTEVLNYWTLASAPLDYAGTQYNLGTAYSDLALIEDYDGNLHRAIDAFTEVLEYWTQDTTPHYYAMTQNNLGSVYSDLAGIEDPATNLHCAIDAYIKALKYRTPATAPLDYASTQNNLGLAYRELARVEDREGNMRRAIDAFTEALKYRTPSADPHGYAGTQHNLGAMYHDLASSTDRESNLNQAITCLTEVLRYYTPTTAPYDYAQTQHGLGIVLNDFGNLAGAVACWRAAEIYYRRMGAVDRADLMLRWIADGEQRLNAPPE